jgi:tRNA pseudouridine(38-40) synthase
MKQSAAAAAAAAVTAATAVRTSKRRVAFTLAYLGDHFLGSQHQGPDLRTCEQRLERAVYRAGMLAPSNYGDPLKNGFSRASRTDKGVHALSAVVSLKIEVPGDGVFDPCTGSLDPSVVDRIRAHLPADMAVLSCTRVGKRFSARQAANYRSYRYHLPKHIFFNNKDTINTKTMEEVRASLQHNLAAFCGTHFFHNFTRGSARKHGAHALPENMGFGRGHSSLRRSILHCGIEDENERYFHIRIAGQSFIYNQIRAMVGTAAAVTAGLLPDRQPRAALSELAPLFATPAPLAPAAPLVQTDCSFTPQSSVLMRASDAREVFGESATPRKTDPNRPLRVLMDSAAEARAVRFMEDVISGPMWDRCRESSTLEEFLGLDAAGGAGLARLLESEWVQVEEQESGRPFREKVLLSENVRLPNGLATAAAVRFGLRPGCLIKDALNSLKEEQGKLHELGGTPHPDMETCLEMLEPRLRK